jgi:hypothetical protein
MFDQIFNGLNFGAGIGVVGQAVTGSEALRRHASFRADIANGNFRNVANTLNTANIGVAIPAGQTIAGATLRSSGLFPENFITANPQFGVMEMRDNSAAQLPLDANPTDCARNRNRIRRRGHGAAQASRRRRERRGTTETYRDFMHRHADYTVASFQRTHNFRGYATFELPFGPGRLIGSNSNGVLARVMEGWQFGSIFDFSTGAPLNVSATTTINRTGPDASTFPRTGDVTWAEAVRQLLPQTLYR